MTLASEFFLLLPRQEATVELDWEILVDQAVEWKLTGQGRL